MSGTHRVQAWGIGKAGSHASVAGSSDLTDVSVAVVSHCVTAHAL